MTPLKPRTCARILATIVVALAAMFLISSCGLQRPASNWPLFPVQVKGKYGYINKEGQIVLAPRFLWARNFGDRLARVGVAGGVDYVNKTGKAVFRFKGPGKDETHGFRNGLAGLKTGKKWGFIDEKGRSVVKPQFAMVGDFFEGRAAVTLDPGTAPSGAGAGSAKWGYIDKTGKMVVKPDFGLFVLQGNTTTGDFHEGLAAVQLGGKWGYIDQTGKLAVPANFTYASFFSEGVAMVQISGRIAYIDKTGKVAIKTDYIKGGNFKGGLAPVGTADKYGYIDKSGKLAIPLRFEGAADFAEGLAAVKVQGRWGYVDKKGETIVEPQFDEVLPFDRGLAPVALRGKDGYIDKTGNLVWPQGQ